MKAANSEFGLHCLTSPSPACLLCTLNQSHVVSHEPDRSAAVSHLTDNNTEHPNTSLYNTSALYGEVSGQRAVGFPPLSQ